MLFCLPCERRVALQTFAFSVRDVEGRTQRSAERSLALEWKKAELGPGRTDSLLVTDGQTFDGRRTFVYEERRRGKTNKPACVTQRANKTNDIGGNRLRLHNGLWASVMTGGCGAGMPWWWEWIDRHELWQQFTSLSTFVADIDWPAEQFRSSQRAMVSAQPDPEHGFGSHPM